MTDVTVPLDEIHLSDVEGFWTRPVAEREAAFATLRRERPIAFFTETEVEGITRGPGYYAITRYDDIIEASKNPHLFCSGKGTNVLDLPPEFNEFFGSMINMDDPRHARLRKIVSSGFTPRMLKKIEDNVGRVATAVVDRFVEIGEGDFVAEVAAPFPLEIICDMMGIPQSQRKMVLEKSNIILSQGDPELIPEDADLLGSFLQAGGDLAALMYEVAAARRGNEDHDDLTTALVNAEIDGESLTHEELASFFVLLCAAGNETTRNAISWGLVYLTENPDQREIWRNDIEGVTPTAVEEIVRMASPVIHFRRTVTVDGARLGDHEFRAGDKVVLFYPSANRDEAVFDRPFDFDVRRSPNHHVGFGGPGPHYCLGAHLARREIGVIYRELLHKAPGLVATGEPARLRSSFINGVKRLPCSVLSDR